MNDKVRAKKYLGQHFLIHQPTARKIVEAIAPNTEHLLEIGPGMGVLTKWILEHPPKQFKLIEIDTESVVYLQTHFPTLLPEQIISADVLKIDISSVFSQPFSIIGNFPYNISSQILFMVWEHRQQVQEVVGMFQKEVAERIAAPPGKKSYGILSVLLQAFYDIEYLFTVEEGFFSPPPKVKSGVIRLRRNQVPQLPCSEAFFKTVVKTAFNQRRKTLSNSLKSLGFKDHKDSLEAYASQRPEQLDVTAFVVICQVLEKGRKEIAYRWDEVI